MLKITALIISIVYIVLISLYILVSGRIALSVSATVAILEHIEIIKGLVFVCVTGGSLFVAAYVSFDKIAKQDTLIITQNKSIIASERLVMAGIFCSSVCHDINNIMTIISGHAQFLIEAESLHGKERAWANQILESSNTMTQLVKRMMESGKGYVPDRMEKENLSWVITDTIDFAAIHIKVRQCRVIREVGQELHAHINSSLIRRAVMNLILNAADATHGIGYILIRLIQDHGYAVIEVHDDGLGINEDMKEKIFEPFFTSKTDGNGLGLLSLKICAQQHNGIIELADSHLGGACFILKFPMECHVSPT